MIFVVHGNLREKVLAGFVELKDKMIRANPDALQIRFSTENFSRERFEELMGGRSLFKEKFIVLSDGLFEKAEIGDFLLEKISLIAESDTIFIFREGKLTKKYLDAIKKAGGKLEEFSDSESAKKQGYAGAREIKLRAGYEGYNIFSFTDAIGARDKKNAWVLYQKGLRAGLPAEELFWKIVWIFRNIILVSSINSDHAGLQTKFSVSPFILGKCRGFVKNYSVESLIDNYKKLNDIYYQFRRGEVEVELAVEQFILNL